MLQEENVVLSAVEKDQPVFQHFVQRRKIIAEERPPRFGNDILLDVGKHLRDLLSNAADHLSSVPIAAPRVAL